MGTLWTVFSQLCWCITVRLYADNTKSHLTISDHLDQLQLQCDLNNLQRWSAEHCMKFNIKKYRQTCVTKEKNPLHYYYNISSTRAPRGTKVKDLGVSVSHNLSWNDHVGIVLDKANKMLGLLYRTCWDDCDQRTLLMLYKTLVRPHHKLYRLAGQSEFTSEFTDLHALHNKGVIKCLP